jgi:release factor glutamine methyltransferase
MGSARAPLSDPPDRKMTVAEALAWAGARLGAAGVDSPEHDAEVLLRHVLGWDRARVVVEARTALATADEAAFRGLIEERAGRRPLQHLTGRQWFWRHEFVVSSDVLVPRPETELLVEEALARLAQLPAAPAPLVADVGTGSGCIALSVAAERPAAEVVAIDVSAEALMVARANTARLGLEARVRLVQGDLLAPLADRFGSVDLVVSNPPYVDPAAREALPPEVRFHDPPLALFPPGDACAVYRRLVPQAFAALRPGGALLLEIGEGMAEEVARLCASAGLAVERVVPDLRSIPRVVCARR